ncbi:MAG: hypothetical protein R8F63_00730 [Acidimicrobiales bacterium]|nr:hypothetical protein [Acidimicrobiales bacterium]
MATRPVFVPNPAALVEEVLVDFEWFPGFAVSQKQKSIAALHAAARERLASGTQILEVSTKSLERIGAQLSAFNLRIESPELGRPILLEAAFQGSKVFAESGQHPYLYEIDDGREIKKRVGEYSGERVVGFRFGGEDWMTEPVTAFYDWLYLSALERSFADAPEARDELVEFDAFTDIEFNPDRSINCQARSCALYVSMSCGRDLSVLADRQQFVEYLREHGYGTSGGEAVPETLF